MQIHMINIELLAQNKLCGIDAKTQTLQNRVFESILLNIKKTFQKYAYSLLHVISIFDAQNTQKYTKNNRKNKSIISAFPCIRCTAANYHISVFPYFRVFFARKKTYPPSEAEMVTNKKTLLFAVSREKKPEIRAKHKNATY
eukprot:GEMP01083622.1.p1 GENE.GEMP01083622.1~~GEMP01083622.1.p1  ORF type:complete len:142 (-),score=1.49 GEMP01083622.1:373-798(-)